MRNLKGHIHHRSVPLPPADECRAARLRAGLSQQEVADAVGCLKVSVGQWERGMSLPSARHLLTYAAVVKFLQRRFPAPPVELPPVSDRAQLRRALGMTQQDVADVMSVTTNTVSCWERGMKEPSQRHRLRYAGLLAGGTAAAAV